MNELASPTLSGALRAIVALVIALPQFVSAQNAGPAPTPKTTDQAFKNIQILKGIPADQLIPSMQFVAASLGVECEFCHVEGAFDKDDKKPKQTARKMMEMMFAINKNNFENRRNVTCYSCHRGSAHPASIPVIGAAVGEPGRAPEKASHAEDQGTNTAAAVDPVLEKYVLALGGPSILQKITSRVEKGTADLGGKQFPIEIYAKAPDKRLSVMHLTNGDSITAFNGTGGWLSVPGHPTQWMSPGEADAARLDADLLLPLRLKQIFTDLRLMTGQKIDDRDVNFLQGRREGKPPVNFFFDQRSGLLVRVVRFIETPLGLNPTQIDYADYRDSGGSKIPYRWTIARPRGQFTVNLEAVSSNSPIDEKRFAPPAPVDPKPPSP